MSDDNRESPEHNLYNAFTILPAGRVTWSQVEASQEEVPAKGVTPKNMMEHICSQQKFVPDRRINRPRVPVSILEFWNAADELGNGSNDFLNGANEFGNGADDL